MKHLSLTLLFFLSLSSIASRAQTATSSIKVLAKVKNNDVWLRWVPTSYNVWQLGNRNGYTIERYILKADGTLATNEPVKPASSEIKPYSRQEFEKLGQFVKEAQAIEELIYNQGDDATSVMDNPATILRNQDETNNRFGIALLICDLKPVLAKAAGLFFNDTTAISGTRYIYKITVASPTPALKIEPAVIVVDVTESKSLQAFNDLRADFGDKAATLSWPLFTHRGTYSAYLVEKSVDGNNYTAITDLPYVPMNESTRNQEAHFVDSLADNLTKVFYRVKGITPFGEEGPASNIVSGTGKDNVSGLLILREVKHVENKVLIQWEFPIDRENQIAGFMISKASKADGPYKDITPKVLNKSSRSFIETASASSAYYQARAVDAQGAEVTHALPYFLHTEDNTPPAVPSGLTGNVNDKGLVSLSWKAVADSDLLGYRVFSSNSLRDEFVEATQDIVITTFFKDTINTSVLNKKIFYKVIAVDKNFNTSGYSKPLTLARPDHIPPAPPAFTKTEKKDKSISLEWVESPSNDVSNYALYRTTAKDTLKVKILSWRAGKKENSFMDNAIPEGNRYRYVLYVYDSAGNHSMATSKEINMETGIRKRLDDLTAIIDRDNKNITLKWMYDAPAKKCLLYRRKNGDNFTLYQTLDGTLQKFIDTQITPNNVYSYKIQLVLETNAKTQLSQELKVPY